MDYKEKCSTDYCSRNKLSCESFKVWKSIIDTKIRRIKHEDKILVKNFNKFTHNIVQCLNRIKYQWNSNDLCKNELKCFYFDSNKTFFEKSNFLRLSPCPCSGKYRTKCGPSFCALNKNVCDSMQVWLKSIDYSADHWLLLEKFSFTKCENNDNKIYKEI